MNSRAPVLIEALYKAMHKHADKTAIIVRKQGYTFAQLAQQTKAYATQLARGECKRIAIFGTRSFENYCAVLSSILTTTTYVCINSYFPAHKSAFIFRHSDSSGLVICNEEVAPAFEMLSEHVAAQSIAACRLFFTATTLEQLKEKLRAYAQSNNADSDKVKALEDAFARGVVLPESESDKEALALQFDFEKVLREYDSQALQHFMYTSGTTGQPKGVMINYESYSWYFFALIERLGFNEQDVFSHFSELTFDLSLEDFLIPVYLGGTVVCPSKKDLMNQIGYINKYGITVYHTLPSAITQMERVGIVPKEPITSLRIASFAGEPLLYKQLCYLRKNFPNVRMFNTYGPTECTVILGVEEVRQENIVEQMQLNGGNGIVPLGEPLKDGVIVVCDELGNEQPDGTQGEAWIGGPQVGVGYLNNPTKTAEVFVERNGERFYRTGDNVVYQTHLDQTTGKQVRKLHYIGRTDDMVKVGGYRISLYESDEVLGSLTSKAVRTIAYELEDEIGKSNILIAVIEGATDEECAQVKAASAAVMELYMRPRLVLAMDNFPLNSNGKVDRKQIKAHFEAFVQDKIKLYH